MTVCLLLAVMFSVIAGAVSKSLAREPSSGSLETEHWFHGQISRVQVSTPVHVSLCL